MNSTLKRLRINESIKITDFAVELHRIEEIKLGPQPMPRSKGVKGGTSRTQAFQPTALSGSCRTCVMPVFMIAVAVAAFWFAAVSAIACSVVILSAFSVLFLLALGRSMAVFAAVIALGDFQFSSVLLSVVEAIVDVDALLDTAVCSVGVVKIIIESLSSFRRSGAMLTIGKVLAFSTCLMDFSSES